MRSDAAQLLGGDRDMNHNLEGLTPLQCLDKIVAYCGQVVTATRFIQEPLWYLYYMEERFIADWMMLPIVAADLWNELKKNCTWGNGDLATDWRLAAENPDWEGTSLWPGSSPYAAARSWPTAGRVVLVRSSNIPAVLLHGEAGHRWPSTAVVGVDH
jgi:hypothetical protein